MELIIGAIPLLITLLFLFAVLRAVDLLRVIRDGQRETNMLLRQLLARQGGLQEDV